MSREELIKKMRDATENAWFESVRSNPECVGSWEKVASVALDVAVGELLKPLTHDESGYADFNVFGNDILKDRRSHYLKPKSDPAVEAVMKLLKDDKIYTNEHAEQIVAAVRKADHERI